MEKDSDSLRRAIELIKAGNKIEAQRLLEPLLKSDMSNIIAWLLYVETWPTTEQRVKALELCLRYNPDNERVKQDLRVLRGYQSSTPFVSSAVAPVSPLPSATTPAKNPRLKKCPYCAEEIQQEAIVCKHCGRDLTKEPPEVITQKRIQLTQKLAELEKSVATWEQYLRDQNQLEQQAGRQITWALLGILVGLFLIPVLIGLILVPAGILAGLTQGANKREAQSNQTKARQNIESIRKQIVEVRTQLATLQ